MIRTLIRNAAREAVDAWKDKLIVELGGFTQTHHEAVYETLADHIDTLRTEKAEAATLEGRACDIMRESVNQLRADADDRIKRIAALELERDVAVSERNATRELLFADGEARKALRAVAEERGDARRELAEARRELAALKASAVTQPGSVLHVVEHKKAGEWAIWTVAKSADDAIKGADAVAVCNPDCEARAVEYWRADHTARASKAGV
jgi:hypothetical protein